MQRVRAILLIGLLLLAACTPTSTDEPSVDPQELLQNAVDNLRALDSFRIELIQGGEPFRFEFQFGEGEIPFVTALRRAEGAFIAPDLLWADARITFQELPVTVGLLATSTGQWIRALGGGWIAYEYAAGFDPSTMMVDGRGFSRAMNELDSLEYVGQETRNGLSVYHMTGTASGEVVNDILFGLLTILQDVVLVDVYVQTETEQVSTLILTLPNTASEGEEDTYWSIDVYDYNADIDLDIPEEAN